MLACFTSIADDDIKEILVSAQQDMIFLSPEEIDKLCDVNKLKKNKSKNINNGIKKITKCSERI